MDADTTTVRGRADKLKALEARCGAIRTMLDDVSQLIDSALAGEARLRRDLDNTVEQVRELMKEETE